MSTLDAILEGRPATDQEEREDTIRTLRKGADTKERRAMTLIVEAGEMRRLAEKFEKIQEH